MEVRNEKPPFRSASRSATLHSVRSVFIRWNRDASKSAITRKTPKWPAPKDACGGTSHAELYIRFGMPHKWLSLNGFLREVRRFSFTRLRRRSQTNCRIGWNRFETVTSHFPVPEPRITHPGRHGRLDSGRFREEPDTGDPPVRIRAGVAEWRSYSTTIQVVTRGRWNLPETDRLACVLPARKL